MKVGELDSDINLQKVKVRLSKELISDENLELSGLSTREVYLMGPAMGDFFVKESLNSNRIFPLFYSTIPIDLLLDLEVIEQ
jgi:hypothetical protein